MSYRVYATAQSIPGSHARTLELMHQMYPLLIDRGEQSVRSFMIDVGGPATGRIVTEFEFASMEDWARWRAQVHTNPAYQEVFGTMISETAMPGSFQVLGGAELLIG